jgi:cytidine deaminase
MNTKIINNNLIQSAKKYQSRAKSIYSNYPVGAALLDTNDNIHGGCNVESSSYGLTICAERVALTKALSEGITNFTKIAIVGPNNEYCPPCGACRQLLYDYAPEIEIILTNDSKTKSIKLKELLPFAFEDKNLKKL